MPMTITIPPLDRTAATFRTDLDTFFMTTYPAWNAEANALQADVSAKQSTVSIAADAVLSAVDAAMAAGLADAAANATTATDKAGIATTKATEAAASADAAAASAASASAVSGIPPIAGNSTRFLRVTPDGTGMEWVDGASVTLTGNLAPHATQTTALVITNYDSATTYAVTATGGTVSRSGDTITYVAGPAIGTFAITITAGPAVRAIPVTVQTSVIAAPGITSPPLGATGIGQSPKIVTGAFSYYGIADTHLNTDWEIRTAAAGAGALIASSLADAANKLNWTVPSGLLSVSTTYFARARHRGTALGAGAWSESSFTTREAFAPTVPGTAYQGGFYAGRITIDGTAYAIIVAPKSSGHSAGMVWKATGDTTPGTLSLNDGMANSEAMNSAAHPAAQFCRGLAIGGYADWYLPSRDELEVCYRALKPTTAGNTVYASRLVDVGSGNGCDAQGNGDNDNSAPPCAAYTTSNPSMTAATAFQSAGAEFFASQGYWSSTESAASGSWFQGFASGNQNVSGKSNANCVRAVRKVLI